MPVNRLPKSLLVAIAVMFGGCAIGVQPSATSEYLDTATGLTVTHLDGVAVFSHAAPDLAAHVRDYLYVGPVEFNRSGDREYYLWVGAWTTIDRLPENEQADGPSDLRLDKLILMLDGQPMALPDQAIPGSRYAEFRHPYQLPVSAGRTAYLRVSLDQLRRLAVAKQLTIELPHGEKVRTYRLWDGDVESFDQVMSVMSN